MGYGGIILSSQKLDPKKKTELNSLWVFEIEFFVERLSKTAESGGAILWL